MSTSDRRFQAALAVMQGLAASLEWSAGLITHPEEMAADAVANAADALLAELEKIVGARAGVRKAESAAPCHPESLSSNQRVSEKLTVKQALDMARRCRYLDNGPVCYDKTLYGAVWALADEVERLRSVGETF